MTVPEIEKVRAALEYGLDHFKRNHVKNIPQRLMFEEALSELDGMVLVPVEPTLEMIDAMRSKGTWEKAYRAMIAPYIEKLNCPMCGEYDRDKGLCCPDCGGAITKPPYECPVCFTWHLTKKEPQIKGVEMACHAADKELGDYSGALKMYTEKTK